MSKHLRLIAAAIAVALIGLTAFAALPAYAGNGNDDKGSDKANEKSGGDADKDESGDNDDESGGEEKKDDPEPQAPADDSGKGNGSGGGAKDGSAAQSAPKGSSAGTTTVTVEQHCPDHALLEAAGYKFGPGGGTTPDGVTVTVSGTTVTFSSPVTFCVKAGSAISGVLTGSSYTVNFLNDGGQFPNISHLVVYPSGPCVDDPATTENECDPEEPPCVDDESTPVDECDEEEPPCVDDLDTPEDECDEDEVGGKRIDRPGDPADPVSPEVQPRSRVKGAPLPFTGGDVFALGVLAVTLIGSGVMVTASTRRRQSVRVTKA